MGAPFLRATTIAALLSALLACSDTVQVDLPSLSGAHTLLLVTDDGEAVRVHAYAVDEGEPVLRFDVASLEDLAAYALIYTESVAELGLAAGELEVVTDEPKKPLEHGVTEYALVLDDAQRTTSWAPSPARPEWVASVGLRGTPSPCTRFAVRPLDVLPENDLRNEWGFAVPEDDHVVAGTSFGELYRIGSTGQATLLEPPDDGVLQATAGIHDAERRPWIGDLFGRLWRGEPGSQPKSWRIVSGSTPVSRIDFMDVAPDGSEVLVLARDGTVALFTTATERWRVLHRIRTEDDSTTRKGGVVWLGPDDYLAAGPFEAAIDHLRGATVVQESTGAQAGITSLRRVEGVGVIAGSGQGEVFVRQSARWQPYPTSGSLLWVLGTAAYEGGLVFGSPYGNFGQYPRTDVACPLTTPVSFFIRFITPVGADLVLLGEGLAPPAPGGAVLVAPMR